MTQQTDEHPDVKKWRDRFAWAVIFNIIIVIAFAITAGVMFDKFFKNKIIPKNFAQVDDDGLLFRSGLLDHDIIGNVLHDNEIDLVISMTAVEGERGSKEDRDIQGVVQTAERMGIEQHFWPLGGDGTGRLEHYIGAVSQLKRAHDAGRPTLVHCAAGSYRTGGVYAIWRLFVDGWEPQRVRDEMGLYGMDDDNILVAYLNEHMETIAHRLVDEGVIDQVPDPLPVLPN